MTTAELSNAELKAFAPSIFATEPWSGVSSRYAFIPTIKVIDAFRDSGMVPVSATQSTARIPGKQMFTKHCVRFRNLKDAKGYPKVVDGNAHHFYKKGTEPEFIEQVLTNAHDRSCAYYLETGLYRQLCSNGLVVSSGMIGAYATNHTGDIVEEVLEASKEIIKAAPLVREQVGRWKALMLSDKAKLTMADAALIHRYGIDDTGRILSPITAEQILTHRRPEDAGNSLWMVMNVIQENLIKGDIAGLSTNGRPITTRAIKAVQRNLEINRGVWSIAEVMAERLAA